MSTMYDISISRVEGDEVDFDVVVVHPDAGGAGECASFSLRLMWDPLDEYKYGKEKRVKESPLAQEMDLRDYLSESFIAEHALGFVESVEVEDIENHPPPYWGDEGYEEFWQSDQRSVGRLKVKVHHPGWIAHLREGMSWDTAAYASYDAKPWTRAPRRPGDKLRTVSEDPMEGMREQRRENVGEFMRDDIKLEEFILPLKGAKHYQAPIQYRPAEITEEVIEELLGQPVLVQTNYRLEARSVVGFDADNRSFYLYYESEGSSGGGGTGSNFSWIEWIGRAYYIREQWADEVEV